MVSIHHCSANPREEMPDDHDYIDDLTPLDLDDEAVKERLDTRFRSRTHQCAEKPTQVGFLLLSFLFLMAS